MKVTLGTVCRDRNSSKRQERPIQKVVIVLALISGSPVAHKLVSPTAPTKRVAIVEMNTRRDLMGPTIDITLLYLYRYAENPT